MYKNKNYAHNLRQDIGSNKIFIGYFDESVQHNKWGLTSPKDHETEILDMVNFCNKNEKVVLVIKTQFVSNLPSKLFRNNEEIKKAIFSGRLIEIHQGKHRNDILPSTLGILCDICIGHSYGGTASLEAALVGCKSILIDNKGFLSPLEELNKVEDNLIKFPSVLNFLTKLKEYDFSTDWIGNWDFLLEDTSLNKDFNAQLNDLIDNIENR